MKIKKQTDGKYYEKIVTWKKKPNYLFRFLGVLCILSFIIFLFFFTKVPESNFPELVKEGSIDNFHFLMVISGEILIMVGTLVGGVLLIIFSIGEKRKIKFRRISS